MATKKDAIQKHVNIQNRRASYEYHFLERFTAGVVLTGTEIKSIRQARINMQDAYAYFRDTELWIKGLHISPYENGTYTNHAPDRERKLLLTKKELRRLFKKSEENGITIVPVRLFISERGWAKLDIALARGKKLYDKREDIKTKDTERELARMH